MGDSHSLYDLLCTENESSLNADVADDYAFIDYSVRNNNTVSDDDDEDEYVKILLDRELSFGFLKDESLVTDNSIRCARLDSIDWILKTRDVFGFRFQTAYLSMTYFDRFLSKRSINSGKLWAIQLLSVACLSLAAKMEESKVPALSKFPMEDFEFESKVIQRMELLVLNTLEWRMASISPFAFIPYFISKLGSSSQPNGLISTTAQLILAVMKEINLVNYRPSVIAAAGTLAALEQRLTRKELESRMKDLPSRGNLNIEEIFTLYNLMHQLKLKELKPSNLITSPNLSPSQFRPVFGSLESPSVTPALSNKRKRLTFDDNDQNDGKPDEKRRN